MTLMLPGSVWYQEEHHACKQEKSSKTEQIGRNESHIYQQKIIKRGGDRDRDVERGVCDKLKRNTTSTQGQGEYGAPLLILQERWAPKKSLNNKQPAGGG